LSPTLIKTMLICFDCFSFVFKGNHYIKIVFQYNTFELHRSLHNVCHNWLDRSPIKSQLLNNSSLVHLLFCTKLWVIRHCTAFHCLSTIIKWRKEWPEKLRALTGIEQHWLWLNTKHLLLLHIIPNSRQKMCECRYALQTGSINNYVL